MPRAPIAVVLEELVAWYAARVYGVLEGPGRVPFYCDPARVGGFAVAPAALAAILAPVTVESDVRRGHVTREVDLRFDRL